jgi:Raf kinase inhibitor-like YbhB/YbcL family protein
MKTNIMLLVAWALFCPISQAGEFKLQSPTWRNAGTVPGESLYSDCGGKNISPPLSWVGAPTGTKSFAITLFDPDAPGGHGWWHWVLFDLGPNTQNLAAGTGSGRQLPAGSKQTRNDYGSLGYGGPCPPPGSTHRYVLAIAALDLPTLSVSAQAPPGQIAALIAKHTLAQASINVRYGR